MRELHIGSTVLNTEDMETSVAFWSAALAYEVRHHDVHFSVLADPDRLWSRLSLQWTDQPKRGSNRVHLDLYAADRDAEIERLMGLGASRVEPWPYADDDSHVVMAAPDGNEFCVVPPEDREADPPPDVARHPGV